MSKSICTVNITKLIHFQWKILKWRYISTVVITPHISITNEIPNWLNHVFMSLLSPLVEPADNESETDGHLTRMGPRLIMNSCPICHGPVFSECKLANSESWLHSHKCTQLDYCFETSSRQNFRGGAFMEIIKSMDLNMENSALCRRHVWLLPFKRTRRDLFMSFPTLDWLVILTAEPVYSGRPGDRFSVRVLLRSEISQ